MQSDRPVDFNKLAVAEKARRLYFYFSGLAAKPEGVDDRTLEQCRNGYTKYRGHMLNEVSAIERALKQ